MPSVSCCDIECLGPALRNAARSVAAGSRMNHSVAAGCCLIQCKPHDSGFAIVPLLHCCTDSLIVAWHGVTLERPGDIICAAAV